MSLGTAQIAQIPLDQIDRVEVVNGNVSALYGSGAIGGVVQVFTKDGGDASAAFQFFRGLRQLITRRRSRWARTARWIKTAARPSAFRSRARKTTAFRRSIRARRPTRIRTRTAI